MDRSLESRSSHVRGILIMHLKIMKVRVRARRAVSYSICSDEANVLDHHGKKGSIYLIYGHELQVVTERMRLRFDDTAELLLLLSLNGLSGLDTWLGCHLEHPLAS